jgi:hypothetical protein
VQKYADYDLKGGAREVRLEREAGEGYNGPRQVGVQRKSKSPSQSDFFGFFYQWQEVEQTAGSLFSWLALPASYACICKWALKESGGFERPREE